jgi:predicted  nucleic acid-binding Zn-ribbon protein
MPLLRRLLDRLNWDADPANWWGGVVPLAEFERSQRAGLEAERRIVAMQRSIDLWIWVAKGAERRLETRLEELGRVGRDWAAAVLRLKERDEQLVEARGRIDYLERELSDTTRAYQEIRERLVKAVPKKGGHR